MKTLILLLLLFVGCLGQPEKVSINKLDEILADSAAYEGKKVNINATVTQTSSSPMGILYKLADGTGEITGVYTGSIYIIDAGYGATFSGEIIRDVSFSGIHGAGVLMRITGIKDVNFVGKVAPPTSTIVEIPSTLKIEQIKKDSFLYSQQESISVRGKTLQAQNAGNYTYVEIDDGADKMWVAIPKGGVVIGKEVTVNGFLMVDFPSKALGKTFDVVLFSTGLDYTEPVLPVATNVSKAGEEYTIEEIHAQKAFLIGTSVKVRANVTGVSGETMGMELIHLQDGTGNASQGTNEIVITYAGHQIFKAGDKLTVTGTVLLNKEFGAGNVFPVVLENSEIQKV